MEILSVDRESAASRLNCDGAPAAEGIGNPSARLGCIKDLADQGVRAACPPAIERDRRRMDLPVPLLMSDTAIERWPVDLLQQICRLVLSHQTPEDRSGPGRDLRLPALRLRRPIEIGRGPPPDPAGS